MRIWSENQRKTKERRTRNEWNENLNVTGLYRHSQEAYKEEQKKFINLWHCLGCAGAYRISLYYPWLMRDTEPALRYECRPFPQKPVESKLLINWFEVTKNIQ